MPHSKPERRDYLPPVPSPLNPAICPDCSRAKRQHSRRPRPAAARQSPTLSHAQHILRAKAAEAWRSEALRRDYGRPAAGAKQKQQQQPDMADGGALARAALDMHLDDGGGEPQAAAVLLHEKGSSLLGLDPILLSPVSPISPALVAAVAEEPGFGMLQPFTVDLTHAGPEYGQPAPRTEAGGQKHQKSKGLARKALLVVGLLCLSYCVMPAVRYRAAFRQGGGLLNS